MSPAAETRQAFSGTAISKVLDGARILIVCEDDSDAGRLRTLLLGAGFDPECARSITAACEAAASGQFQVVISAPEFRDGSWRRLVDLADRYNRHFEVVLWAPNFDLDESAAAIEDGAFEILDSLDEQPKAFEATKRALWTAYLNGAGPKARAVPPYKVA